MADPALAKVVRSCTGNVYCREMAFQVANPAQAIGIAARCGLPAVKKCIGGNDG